MRTIGWEPAVMWRSEALRWRTSSSRSAKSKCMTAPSSAIARASGRRFDTGWTDVGPATLDRTMDEPIKRAPEKPDQQPWRVEGARDRAPEGGGNGPGTPGGGRPRFRLPRWLLWLTLGLLLLNFVVASRVPDDGGREQVPFSTFQDQVEKSNVTEVNAQGDIVQGEFRNEVDSPTDEDKDGDKKFETTLPAFVDAEGLSK